MHLNQIIYITKVLERWRSRKGRAQESDKEDEVDQSPNHGLIKMLEEKDNPGVWKYLSRVILGCICMSSTAISGPLACKIIPKCKEKGKKTQNTKPPPIIVVILATTPIV